MGTLVGVGLLLGAQASAGALGSCLHSCILKLGAGACQISVALPRARVEDLHAEAPCVCPALLPPQQ